jgi:hypothetical protein
MVGGDTQQHVPTDDVRQITTSDYPYGIFRLFLVRYTGIYLWYRSEDPRLIHLCIQDAYYKYLSRTYTHHKPNPNPNDFCLSLLCLSTYRISNC